MRISRRFVMLLALGAGLLLPSAAVACLWDYDTIKMERARFPGTLELITGKFLRHSPEFYKWRIENRLKRLKADPTNAALLDDLAAAYDKTGQHDKAIETAQKTESVHPGRYETAANLATFYFHAGRLEEGLPHIDRALRINPNAHFGREKYQKLLVAYTLQRRKRGNGPSASNPDDGMTFAEFVRVTSGRDRLTNQEVAAAVKGILGMMKFGKHDAPALLEALGSLLSQDFRDPGGDAKLLAARAYLKASYEVPDGPVRAAYREKAGLALQTQAAGRDQLGQMPLETVEQDFQKELAEAKAWYADLRERELSWIRDGKDPEAEFDKLYELEPEVSGMDVKDPILSGGERLGILIIVAGVVFVVLSIAALVVIAFVIRRYIRKRRTLAFEAKL